MSNLSTLEATCGHHDYPLDVFKQELAQTSVVSKILHDIWWVITSKMTKTCYCSKDPISYYEFKESLRYINS